jgi:DNA replication initiation complex subunit (GINS family)
MNYEKLTLDRFGLNLKEGKYQSITGARRAIGKTSGWNAKEKEAAQALANKHFKTEAPPKAAKPTTPTKPAVAAKPVTPPKAAKKVAAKKAPVAAKVQTKDVDPDVMPVKQDEGPRVTRTPVTRYETTANPSEAIAHGEQILAFLGAAAKQLIMHRELNPHGDFTKALTEMDNTFTRAVTLVATSIPSTSSPVEESLPPPRVSLPNQRPAVKSTVVKAPVETKSPPESPVALEATMSSRARVGDPIPSPIVPAPAAPNSDLTPEEQKMADSLRNATPVSSFAGLPRPVVAPAD